MARRQGRRYFPLWLGVVSQAKIAVCTQSFTDHEGMRDFLYSRMRGARDHHSPAMDKPQSGDEQLANTLNEVASELRAIRLLIKEQRPHA